MHVRNGTHAAECKLPYGIWGVVTTLCMSILLPASILPVEALMYESLLAWHALFSIFVLAGCY